MIEGEKCFLNLLVIFTSSIKSENPTEDVRSGGDYGQAGRVTLRASPAHFQSFKKIMKHECDIFKGDFVIYLLFFSLLYFLKKSLEGVMHQRPKVIIELDPLHTPYLISPYPSILSIFVHFSSPKLYMVRTVLKGADPMTQGSGRGAGVGMNIIDTRFQNAGNLFVFSRIFSHALESKIGIYHVYPCFISFGFSIPKITMAYFFTMGTILSFSIFR